MSTPAEVAELLTQERWEPALDALLTAWRAHRTPQLERVITSLSAYLSAGVEPIDVDADDWQDQWEHRARAKRSVELGVLLPLVTRLPKGGVPRRLRAVIEFGPDPRIGAVLVDMVETPPLTASSNFSMWTELFTALPAHADDRVTARLEARMAERGGKSQFWTKLDGWITAVLPKLAKPAALPKGWKAELTQLERQIAALDKGPAPALAETPAVETTWDDVEDLGAVQRSLEAGELGQGLDLLVGYWGQRRSPVIAGLIERLGGLVDVGQEPPGAGASKKERHFAWLTAAEHPSPSAVGPLLASMREGKLGEVEAKIERMVDWRPDPRVTHMMLVLTKDYMLGARARLWRAVYDVLLVHADPRVAADVQSRHDRLADAHVAHRHIAEGREIRRIIDAFNDAVAVDHELSADQVEQVEAIAAILAKQVGSGHEGEQLERSLVEAIVGDWDSDAPRLVYSDWLQSRQDPRGELIAFDLALAQGKKVKGAREKWFKAHKDAVFGPLAGLMSWGHQFERGLLTECHIATDKGGLDVGEDRRREILSDLRWATIRRLRVDYDDEGAAAVFEHAPLLGLEQLDRPNLAALRGFAGRTDTLGLRSLEVSGSESDTDEDWDAFGQLARVLTKLESLEIMIWGRQGGRVTPPVACFRGELVRRTTLLTNGDDRTGGVGRLDEWLERMVASKCPVPNLRVIGPELSAVIRQTKLGKFEVDLTLDSLRRADDDDERVVLECLRRLPRRNITHLELRLEGVADALRPHVDEALEGLSVERVDADPG